MSGRRGSSVTSPCWSKVFVQELVENGQLLLLKVSEWDDVYGD